MDSEIRSYKCELKREGDKVSGHSSIFQEIVTIFDDKGPGKEPDSFSFDPNHSFSEAFMPLSISASIRTDEIKAYFKSNADYVLGSNRDGRLKMYDDEVGLRIIVTPPDTTYGRDFLRSVQAGSISHVLFSFETLSEEWIHGNLIADDKNEFDMRKILKARLHHISFESSPIFDGVEIAKQSHEAWRFGKVYDLEKLRQKLKEKVNL